MSENKFKVGDRVGLISQYPNDLSPFGVELNNQGTIFTLLGESTLFVNFDNSAAPLYVEFNQIELVEEKNQPEVPKQQGTKHDQGKPRISLIPTDALWGMGRALAYGEKKYGQHNFRNGLAYSRLVDATLRHLTAWNEGENSDSESGLSHLDHALASLAMLKYMEVNRADMDDRWLNPIHNKTDLEISDLELSEEEMYELSKSIQDRGR